MRVDAAAGRLRVSDGGTVVCRIGAGDWADAGDAPRIDVPVEARIEGRASRLRFPPGRADGIGDAGVRGTIRTAAGVTAALAIEGPATVADRPGGVEVSLGEPRPVAIGVRPRERDRTMTVPGTPEGVAAALTYASAAHETTTPARSNPATRRPAPAIARGEEIEVPGAVRSRRADTGIELRVPRDLDALFVLAPLAHYLGARVSVESREAPVLLAPDVGVRHELAPLPRLQADAAALLYRSVVLDCLVRTAGDGPAGPSVDRLSAVGIDPARVGSRGVAGRLAAYLDAPFGTIEDDLPAWHLSVYAAPDPDRVTALPYVLDRLAFVYLADATPLEDEERLRRSLDDFYRGRTVPTVDPILPDLDRGRVHGWLAEGVPIEAFTLLPEARVNRLAGPPPGGSADVTLVVNDGEMSREGATIRRAYDDRSDVDLRVEHGLDRAALAEALRRPTDLCHYVGHCEEAGLRCVDGHLSAADLERSGARAFFLNACGSYHEGTALVEAGSVAGAVTLRPVLDDQAWRVGAAFARLLARGFAIERALRIASRRSIANKDYAVVGDGAYTPCGTGRSGGAIARITRAGDRFRVTVEHGSVRSTPTYHPALVGESPCLAGTERSAAMSRGELCGFLDGLAIPAVYEDQYYWAPDLRRALRDGDA